MRRTRSRPFLSRRGHRRAVEHALDELLEDLAVAVPLEQSRLGDRRDTIDLAKEAKRSRLGIVPGVDLGAAVVTQDRHPEIVAVPGICGPGGIELKRQPAVESDERRGEILDFVRFAGCDLEPPPCH